VRAYAIEGHGPAALLSRLDRVVQALDEVSFTTCVVGVLDPVTRNLCLSSAGHLWPLLIAPDGTAEFLELDPGLPLGVGEAHFVDQWFDLDAGSTVLLYTDGLVEGRHCPVEEGMQRLRAACSAPVRSADELCDRVLHVLREDGDHDDDTALLAVLLDAADADAQPPLLLELGASPESAGTARDALCEMLGEDAGEPAELACLLLTELVANAVRYAGGQILVRAGVRADLLLVEVRDTSERMPVLVANPRHDAEGGRGMLLVDRLADRWGAEPLPVGKRVWFELSLDRSG
jgi:anti-sigma regulatory factor (Ser/Thr protein kinase)